MASIKNVQVGGRVVLSYNIGNGEVELKHPKSIADGKYHVLQIYRTGSNVTLNIGKQSVQSIPIG